MELLKLRSEIDLVDNEIIILLQKRFEIINEVAKYKKLHNINAVQPGRWQELLQDRKNLAKNLDLSEEMIEEIWNIIHKYSIQKEEDIIN